MQPLSVLLSEEQTFQEEIAKFARSVIAPHVAEMDENESLHPKVIEGCFELGLMGVEIPEKYHGAGGSFFMTCLAIEEIAKIRSSC